MGHLYAVQILCRAFCIRPACIRRVFGCYFFVMGLCDMIVVHGLMHTYRLYIGLLKNQIPWIKREVILCYSRRKLCVACVICIYIPVGIFLHELSNCDRVVNTVIVLMLATIGPRCDCI